MTQLEVILLGVCALLSVQVLLLWQRINSLHEWLRVQSEVTHLLVRSQDLNDQQFKVLFTPPYLQRKPGKEWPS